eukprot:3394667-Prymnesium_polylepis.2
MPDGRDAALGLARDALVRLGPAGTWNVGPTESVCKLAAFGVDDVGDDASHRCGFEEHVGLGSGRFLFGRGVCVVSASYMHPICCDM